MLLPFLACLCRHPKDWQIFGERERERESNKSIETNLRTRVILGWASRRIIILCLVTCIDVMMSMLLGFNKVRMMPPHCGCAYIFIGVDVATRVRDGTPLGSYLESKSISNNDCIYRSYNLI
jgi:hypothetical protein